MKVSTIKINRNPRPVGETRWLQLRDGHSKCNISPNPSFNVRWCFSPNTHRIHTVKKGT